MNSHGSQTPQLDALNVSLRTFQNSESVHLAILDELWGASDHHSSMQAYFEYYSKRIQLQRINGNGKLPANLESHSDIISIAKDILSGASRDDIFQQVALVTNSTSTAADISRSIEMCASLILMAEIELERDPTRLTGRTFIPWKQGSLKDTLKSYFSPQQTLQADQSKLGGIFTARNLSCIAGLEIIWTSNLADHLRLFDDDQSVAIFSCASFLQIQKSLGDNSLFPAPFVQETLDTLRLLLPSSDKKTKRWLKKFTEIDSRLKVCGSLGNRERRLENFTYWHDRLVVLKQVFDESSPKTFRQWRHDKRDGVQWYTFWVAIFVCVITGFFGILQCVESAWQILLAYKSMRSD